MLVLCACAWEELGAYQKWIERCSVMMEVESGKRLEKVEARVVLKLQHLWGHGEKFRLQVWVG